MSKDILIVDDEAAIRQVVGEILEDEGYRPRGAANSDEAMREMARRAPSLVLLDFVMPQMSGWTFLERMRAVPALGDVPVVAISALSVAHPGVSAALRKPFDLPSLLQTVERFARCA